VPTAIPGYRDTGEENAGQCHRDRGKRNRGTGEQGNPADHHRGPRQPRAQDDQAVPADDPSRP
jgi:hypothetical protein